MTVHVLDTAAVYHLANKPRSPLRTKLSAEADVFVPVVVLVEAEQASAIPKKRWEALTPDVFDVVDLLETRTAQRASAALRELKRLRCPECSALGRPSLVDAIVVTFAADIGAQGEDVIVHTDDVDDLEAVLKALAAKHVTIQRCGP